MPQPANTVEARYLPTSRLISRTCGQVPSICFSATLLFYQRYLEPGISRTPVHSNQICVPSPSGKNRLYIFELPLASFKASLSAKSFIWKWVFIHLQIKLIFDSFQRFYKTSLWSRLKTTRTKWPISHIFAGPGYIEPTSKRGTHLE